MKNFTKYYLEKTFYKLTSILWVVFITISVCFSEKIALSVITGLSLIISKEIVDSKNLNVRKRKLK